MIIERLTARGFPQHLVKLIEDFLQNRCQYVQVGNETSFIFELLAGCVQGSVLGPVIFALCMAPLEEIISRDIISYADDSYNSIEDPNIDRLTEKLQEELRKHVKWLQDSGLVVNEGKTEVIVFHRYHHREISIDLRGTKIVSKASIKALGVHIDENLRWGEHVEQIVKKCKRTLHGLKQIRIYFSVEEFRQICTSLMYSRLYYCCEIWLTPVLSVKLYKRIESVHHQAIRIVLKDYEKKVDKNKLNQISKRATPKEWSDYAHSVLLFKLLTDHEPSNLFSEIIPYIYCERRMPNRPKIILDGKQRASLNIVSNRLHFIAGTIGFDWYNNNTSLNCFKYNAKRRYFSYLGSNPKELS